MKWHIARFWRRYAVILYILIGVLSFGHAAAQHSVAVHNDYTLCLTAANHDPSAIDYCARVYEDLGGTPVVLVGAGAGAFWPLYWTWVEFDKLEGVPS